MKRLAGLIGALLAAAAVLLLPAPPGLPPEGRRMAALFLAVLILWVAEPIPVGVTALLALALQPVFAVAGLPAALSSFASPVLFFVLAMYFIAQAFSASGLDRRFALWLLARAGTGSRRVVFALMAGTAALSTIISDVPCCAMFMAIALGLFDRMRLVPGRSQFAKAVMMGIPIASLIGGVGTPAGSSINVMGIYFIEQHGKVTVPFLHWMAIGMPMALLLTPCAAWILLRCYPPEMESIGDLTEIRRERAGLGPLTAPERKVIAILGAMIALWILGTWFKQLDTVLVAILGSAVMFLPGVGLLTWKQAERGTGWEGLLMIGGVTSLGAASSQSGLAKWLVDASLGYAQNWDPLPVIALISAFTVVIHLLLPIAPVINAVLIPPIALLAVSAGHNPALYGLPVAFTASCAFLLPLDAVALVTYGKGYYRMLDMLGPGALISVCWVAWMTILIRYLGPALGFM